MPMRRQQLSGLIAFASFCLLAAGCMRATRPHMVEIQGIKLPPQYPAAVEVDNFCGSVKVTADPALKAAEVRARARPTSPDAPKAGHLDEAVVVTATAGIVGSERLLKVTGRPADNPPKDVAIDLFIRVPLVRATRVRNAWGR